MPKIKPPSEAEAERLEMLIEECSEVIKASTKILRHGFGSYNPTLPEERQTLNRDDLERELLDLKSVVWAMQQGGELDGEPGYSMLEETWAKKLRYTHHQGEVK